MGTKEKGIMRKELICTFFCILMIAVAFTPGVNAANKIIKSISNQSKTFTSPNGKIEYTFNTRGTTQNFIPGELIVKFKDEIPVSITPDLRTGIDSIDKINAENKIISAQQVFTDAPSSLANIYQFTFPTNADLSSLIQQYQNDPAVDYAERNNILHLAGNQNFTKAITTALSSHDPQGDNHTKIPNDPQYPGQWSLNQPNGCDISAPEAWYIETGSPNVTIAIIDTGVDYNHQDLAANMWTNATGKHGYDYIHNDADPMDDNGHGTFCAGIAAAVTNNSIGMAGVCWNSKIMALKGLDSTGAGSETDLSKCILYAVQNGANIITLSVGTYIPTNLLYTAISYAYDCNVVLVGAAGESNWTNPFYPACYDQVISVTGIGYNDEKLNPSAYTGGSDYGPDVDVAAPALGIRSTGPGNQYISASGGGVASCYVAGIASLLLSKYEQCPCPAQMVKTIVQYTADKVQGGNYSFGTVNASRALIKEPFAVDLVSPPNWEDIKGTIDINGTVWGNGFLYSRLEAGIGDHPSTWTTLFNTSTPQSHFTYSLDTRNLQETLFTIRLLAAYTHGTYNDTMKIHVNNYADGNHTANIYVSEDFNSSTPGWGATHFNKIQEGIAKAKAGDTVFVYDGIYHENLEIHGSLKSSVMVVGQSTDYTIIEGSLNISKVKKFTVNRFTIRMGLINGEQFYPNFALGLFTEILVVSSPKCTIMNCNIINYFEEFYAGYASAIAVLLSPHVMILNNTMTGTEIDEGAGTLFNGFSPKMVISGNTFIDDCMAISLGGTFSNVIENNTFLTCGEAVLFNYAYDNFFYKNRVVGFLFVATFLGTSPRNFIVANDCNSMWGGMAIVGFISLSHGNHFYLNNFISTGACDDNLDFFDKPQGLLDGQGNYWSEFVFMYQLFHNARLPTDRNHDGIWDQPLPIQTMMLSVLHIKHLDRDRFAFVNPIDLKNITDPEVERHIQRIVGGFDSDSSEVQDEAAIQALTIQALRLNPPLLQPVVHIEK
jgi:thermitase